MKKDPKLKRLRGKQVKVHEKLLKKSLIHDKEARRTIKLNLKLRESNLDTGVYG